MELSCYRNEDGPLGYGLCTKVFQFYRNTKL